MTSNATTTPRIEKDVVYGTAGTDSLLLDVYQGQSGAADAERPAIILVHGGGWFRGDKSKELNLASALVAEGYIVFVPDYREAPAHTFPASREDVLAAFSWALASDYEFDRSRVAFFGGSAGGNLVVEAAIATGRPTVSWSGIFDLAGIIESTDATAATPTQQDLDAMQSADINQTGPDDAFLRWTILGEVGGDRSLLVEASSTRRISSTTGPIYLANSLNEFVPVSDPVGLQGALSAHGVPSVLQLVPGTHHAEGYTSDALPGSLAFLRQHLQPS